MAAINQPSVFDKGMFELEEGFIVGDAKEIEGVMQFIRTASMAVGAVASLVAFVFANAAFRGMECTLGFSLILLVPAALCAAVAFDALKVMRCCSIIIDEALSRLGVVSTIIRDVRDIGSYISSGKPAWINEVETQVKSSALLWLTRFMR